MRAESSESVAAATFEKRGGEDTETVRAILDVWPSSPTGEANESSTSNVMEILIQAGMGTVNRDLDVTVPCTFFLVPAL